MSVRISDVDHGFLRLADRLAKKARVRVGILADEPKETEDGDTSPLSLVEIAAIHEFGAPAAGIPQRSFIRGTVDEKRHEIEQLQFAQAKRIVLGQVDPDHAVEQLGAKVAAMMQRRIAQGIPPPNAPETVERKGSSTPLIDTGQLRSSLSYELVKK